MRVVLLGGEGAIAASVPAEVRSATVYARVGPHEFVADGYALQTVPDELLAYNSRNLVAIYGDRDSTGAFIYLHTDGRWYDHPVGQAQYIVNMLRNYRLKPDKVYLDLAIGHNFAMYGLYDYWRQTGSRDAAEMTRGAITTSARVAGRVRTPGGISQYCISQSCLDRRVRNPNYHLTHIGQFIQLFRYTRSDTFARLADTFTADNPNFRSGGTVIFHAGTHVGYLFDSSGNGTASKTLTLGSSSNASYSSRTVPYGWIKPGNGIWFAMSDGYFGGTWIRESSKAYARGFVDRLEYYWHRSLSVSAGTWTAYQFDGNGSVTASRAASTGTTSWGYTSRARINGRSAVYLVSGPLAGFWLPVSAPTSTTLSAAAVEIPSAESGVSQEGSTSRFDAPPMPAEDPLIPPPMPGQQESGPVDGPPDGEIPSAPAGS